MPEKAGKVRERLRKKLEQMKLDRMVKFDKWNELPPDLKLKCVDKLDFKTRWLLRGTSRKEKSLIDSKRFDFEKIVLNSGCQIQARYLDSDGKPHVFKATSSDYQNLINLIPLLAYILRRCNIKEFRIEETAPFKKHEALKLDKLVPAESARIKLLYSDEYNETILYLLKKCWREIDEVHMVSYGNQNLFRDLMKIPAFDHTKVFKTADPVSAGVHFRHFLPMIENWIVNNAPIGKRLVAEDILDESIQSFITKFKERTIYHARSDEHLGLVIRITTDHPYKHILATLIHAHKDMFYCTVINSELEASEYDDYIC